MKVVIQYIKRFKILKLFVLKKFEIQKILLLLIYYNYIILYKRSASYIINFIKNLI